MAKKTKKSTKKKTPRMEKGSLLIATAKAINESEESFDDIAYNAGTSPGTVRRIANETTVRADVDVVQKIYEYLHCCELEF